MPWNPPKNRNQGWNRLLKAIRAVDFDECKKLVFWLRKDEQSKGPDQLKPTPFTPTPGSDSPSE